MLYSEVGKLKVELEWLEEVCDQLVTIRRAWIELGDALAVAQQCLLAGVCRATIYAQRKPPAVDESDLLHSRLNDDEYTWHPSCDSRMLVLSACPPEVRRTSRDSAIARNRRVTALAAELFVPYVSDNSPLAEIVLTGRARQSHLKAHPCP